MSSARASSTPLGAKPAHVVAVFLVHPGGTPTDYQGTQSLGVEGDTEALGLTVIEQPSHLAGRGHQGAAVAPDGARCGLAPQGSEDACEVGPSPGREPQESTDCVDVSDDHEAEASDAGAAGISPTRTEIVLSTARGLRHGTRAAPGRPAC
jgi:hypothetical protein